MPGNRNVIVLQQQGQTRTRRLNHKQLVSWTLLETLRFEDKEDYEYEIWPNVFSHILKIILESFILPFSSRKVSTVILSEEGQTLSRP